MKEAWLFVFNKHFVYPWNSIKVVLHTGFKARNLSGLPRPAKTLQFINELPTDRGRINVLHDRY